MENGLLKPEFVGNQYGCLTIATRIVKYPPKQSGVQVEVHCDLCGRRSFAHLHKMERRVPRGCKQCIRHFGPRCPEWIYRRVQHQWRRCNDPKTICYERYGGRGIEFRFPSVWEATCWIVKHLGVPSDRTLTLDRTNNDGHYEPGNLRWATTSQQMKNRRKMTRPGSRYRRFLAQYPHVKYQHMYLDSLFRYGLSFDQVAQRWDERVKNRKEHIDPSSLYRRFIAQYPNVGYNRSHLSFLLHSGLTFDQIAKRWEQRAARWRSGTS